MHRHMNQRGAALLLLIGITATLAMLSATLVFVIQNQQSATASERSNKQSLYAAEAALDTAVQIAKTGTMSTTAEWLTPGDLDLAFAGAFPTGATVTYRVYDNIAPVDYAVKWDQNLDDMVWVEATATYKGKTTRARALVQQAAMPFAEALPKSALYSDTGITLSGTSDIYAVEDDGLGSTPYNPALHGGQFATTIMAGGTWKTGDSEDLGRFASNASCDLAAPGSPYGQSLAVRANGSVSTPGHDFHPDVGPGKVGFLSDYFDQAAQTDLADESQTGGTPAAAPTAPTAPGAPTAPSSWTSSGFTTINTTLLNTLQSTSSTTTYNAGAVDLLRSGNLTLSRGTSTPGRTFNFRQLYVTGNLTLTGAVTVNATSLYVGGRLQITNATTTTVTDTVGPLYVNGTSTSSVTGARVNLRTTSAYVRGPFTISNTSTTIAALHDLGDLYAVGALNLTGNVAVQTDSLYAGSTATISNTTTAAVTDNLGALYAVGALSVTNRVAITTTSLRARSTATISNSTTTARTHYLGALYADGALNVTGNVALNTTSLYAGSTATLGNTTTTAATDSLGGLYAVGTLNVSGNVAKSATSVYAGADATFTGPTSGIIQHTFGLVYANGYDRTLSFLNNAQIKATAVVSYGNFTISGANTPFTDWLGSIYVRAFSSSDDPGLNTGDVNWSGNASVTSRNYLTPTADPLPMWMGRKWSRTGTYTDEYGNIWVPGNSSTSVVFGSTGASQVWCPLLCTTEKTEVSGNITFGSQTQPMVYFFMCDNNGIYPMWVDWASTGTFYGLMVINESTIVISNGVSTKPSIRGAIFAGCPYGTNSPSKSDITLEDASCVAYDKSIVKTISTSSLKTTTLVTQIVPGSWQQLPVN